MLPAVCCTDLLLSTPCASSCWALAKLAPVLPYTRWIWQQKPQNHRFTNGTLSIHQLWRILCLHFMWHEARWSWPLTFWYSNVIVRLLQCTPFLNLSDFVSEFSSVVSMHWWTKISRLCICDTDLYALSQEDGIINVSVGAMSSMSLLKPLTSTWLHLICNVGLEEGEY